MSCDVAFSVGRTLTVYVYAAASIMYRPAIYGGFHNTLVIAYIHPRVGRQQGIERLVATAILIIRRSPCVLDKRMAIDIQ